MASPEEIRPRALIVPLTRPRIPALSLIQVPIPAPRRGWLNFARASLRTQTVGLFILILAFASISFLISGIVGRVSSDTQREQVALITWRYDTARLSLAAEALRTDLAKMNNSQLAADHQTARLNQTQAETDISFIETEISMIAALNLPSDARAVTTQDADAFHALTAFARQFIAAGPQRWTQGSLTNDELCDYIKQYAHVVRNIPRWVEQVRAGDTYFLAQHVEEERSHIELWDKFGKALGLSSEAIRVAPANAATTRLVERGDELATQGHAAAAVWALEAQTPAVAGAKLAGLSAFYGISSDAGGEYFAVHQHLDVQHSAELRVLCSDGSDNAAAVMSQALWDLLTSVEATLQPV